MVGAHKMILFQEYRLLKAIYEYIEAIYLHDSTLRHVIDH